jgi:ribose transport system ATP-binding protein
MGLLVVIQSFFLVDGTASGLQGLGWVLFFGTALAVGALNWALIDLGRIHPMIATLVTFTALQSISLLLRPIPGGIISRSLVNTLTTKVGPIPISFIVVLLIALVATWWLFRTRGGIVLRAVGSDERMAQLNAIRPVLVRLCVYMGASLIASFGAIMLMAQLGSGTPTGGTSYTLASISAAVIGGVALTGGRGSFLGVLAGALLIQASASVTTFLGLTTAWQSFLVGGLTIVAVAVYSITRSVNKVVDS